MLKGPLFFLFPLFLSSMAMSDSPKPILLTEDFSKPDQGLAQELIENPYITYMADGGYEDSPGIRVTYAGFEKGSERVVLHYKLARQVKSATLRFQVLFEENFQWVMGGKLHGLGPEDPVTGGGERRPQCWSARSMFKENGKISTYLYDQNSDNKWGAGDKTLAPVFQKNTWHQVEFEVLLNDVGQANGSTIVRIDGKEVLNTQGVEFRGEDSTRTLIDQFLFSTFHGGNQPRWAPVDAEGTPIPVYARFDNIEVIENTP